MWPSCDRHVGTRIPSLTGLFTATVANALNMSLYKHLKSKIIYTTLPGCLLSSYSSFQI